MTIWDRLCGWVRGFRSRGGREEDLERELQSHLALEVEEQEDSGLSHEEAHFAARRAFGNATLVKEDVRSIWSPSYLGDFGRDLRQGARALRKSSGFTAVAVLTLALGIGATTAIFSAINATLLRPLPFPEADRLVRIYSTKHGVPITGFAYPGGPSLLDVRDFMQAGHSLQKVVCYDQWRKNVSFGDSSIEPQQMHVGLITADYFGMLSVQPVLGRLFTNDENQEGKQRVAAISARIWQNQFAGDRAVLGRTIRINDEPYTIVAVMPDVIPEWMEPFEIEIWTPIVFTVDDWAETSRNSRGFETLARLKPGVSLEQAKADLATVAAGVAAEHPFDQDVGVEIRRLADTRVGTLRPVLFLLMGAVSLILLIACSNLANLLLARNSARQHELAVHAALGAGRGGLIRLLFAETMLLSLIGGGVGFALAQIGLLTLTKLRPQNLPQLSTISIDWRVLVFALAISLATSVLFGLAPALKATRLNLIDALKQGGRSGNSGQRSERMRNILVVTEVALSLMLLIGAGLLIQSIVRLQGQDLGIRQDHVLRGRFYLPRIRYPDAGAITRFCDEVGSKVRALPAVVDASITTIYPPYNGWTQMLGIPNHPASRFQDVPIAQFGVTDAHLVKTLGVPLIRGRDFSESDSATSFPVALISRELSRRYFANVDPIGRQIHIGPPSFLQIPPGENVSDAKDVIIVGVIGDFKNTGLTVPPEPQIIGLYAQHPLVNYGFKEIVIRTASEPRLLVPEISRQLHEIDPDVPLAEVQTIDEIVEKQTGGQCFTTTLLALFAVAGLALAAVGIYGVVSYLVSQRTQELAVRLAVGASPTNVLCLVLRQGLDMTLLGAVVGLGGAIAARRLTSGLLFGISATDPVTLVGAALFLLVVALMASVIPGARAMRIHPMQALRQE